MSDEVRSYHHRNISVSATKDPTGYAREYYRKYVSEKKRRERRAKVK